MTYERLPFPKVVLQPIPLTIYQGRFCTSLEIILRQMRGCGDSSMNTGLRYEDNRVPICLYHEDDIEQNNVALENKEVVGSTLTLWKEFRKTRSKSTGEQLQLTPEFVEELRRKWL